MSNLTLGLYLGSRRESAAICVAEEDLRNPHESTVEEADEAVARILEGSFEASPAELEERLLALAESERALDQEPELERHYLVRLLERLPANSTYLEIAERLRTILAGLEERSPSRPTVYVDATGKGTPIVQLLKEACPTVRIVTVYFNYGDRRTKEKGHVSLGKAFLVTRLQQLLETGRLHIPRFPGIDELKGDLVDFEIPVRSNANETYGAFPVGSQDDRVTALGLAVHIEPGRWGLT